MVVPFLQVMLFKMLLLQELNMAIIVNAQYASRFITIGFRVLSGLIMNDWSAFIPIDRTFTIPVLFFIAGARNENRAH